jgi:hypothetical protein
MKTNSPQRISAWDRRKVAIHEAGHIVMGARFGWGPVGWIFRNPNVRDIKEEKSWLGKTTFFGSPALSPLELRMVACAGAASECCWRGEEVDPDDWTEPDMMSATDWEMAGCEPGEIDDLCVEAIDRLGPLLSRDGPLWGDLLSHARQLIVGSRPIGSNLGPRSQCVR